MLLKSVTNGKLSAPQALGHALLTGGVLLIADTCTLNAGQPHQKTHPDPGLEPAHLEAVYHPAGAALRKSH